MRVSGIYAGLPFKAQVESTNPLINGNWQYLQDPSAQNSQTTAPQKESHWFRNTLLTLAVIAAAGFGLAKYRGTESVCAIMSKGYENLTSFGEKFKYGIGKLGDWAITAYGKTIGKLMPKG